MNHKLLNKTLKKTNRDLRIELKRVIVELKYTQALFKLLEKKVKEIRK